MATELQEKVWQQISKIPRGKVTTYKELANAVDSQAVRAVASAVGKNPYAPRVPCHRVVLSSGKIGKYTHPLGVSKKIELLKEEGVFVDSKGKVVDFSNKIYRFS